MKSLLSKFGGFFKTGRGRLITLWVITALLLIIALFNGFGQPIFSYIFSTKIEEIAAPNHNRSVYDTWYGKEKDVAKIEGQEWNDPRKKEHASLIGSWKWWIMFGILFMISVCYSAIVLINKGGHLAKDGTVYTGGKLKELWLYMEQKIKESWGAVNKERHINKMFKILEKNFDSSSGIANSKNGGMHPAWKMIFISVICGLILIILLKFFGKCNGIYKRGWAK